MGSLVSLTSGDGHGLKAYVAEPAGAPRFGLVVIQEIFGVNAHIRGVCDGFAADGILAVAPALFDRVEHEVELGYDPDSVAAGRALRGKLGWDAPLEDIEAAAHIAATGGKVGVVGYCWGGSIAWLAACRLGGTIGAAVGYYGGQIHDFKDESAQAPAMLHFGELDGMIPPEHVEAIRAANPAVPVHIYPAGHGFNCEMRADFHADSARLARQRTLEFFGEALR